jgi:phosphatidylglycerol:prolipoprotein diacylglycerol transferase
MYPIMALCGIFAAGIYVCGTAKKEGHDENEAIIFLLLSSIGIFFGSHILYGIVNYRETIFFIKNLRTAESFQELTNTFMYAFGGSVFYGGLAGGIGIGFFYIKKRNKSFSQNSVSFGKSSRKSGLKPAFSYKSKVAFPTTEVLGKPHNLEYLADITAPAIPLFHFFGRIGCFLGGCCFGIESSFGFTTLHGIIDKANGVNRFPVQLLESLFNIITFFILVKLRKVNRFRKRLLYIYLFMYSTGRFFIEFLRRDDYRGKWLFLSTSQIISLLIFGIVMIKYLSIKKMNNRGFA